MLLCLCVGDKNEEMTVHPVSSCFKRYRTEQRKVFVFMYTKLTSIGQVSSLTALHCFEDLYVEKQPVVMKEYCAEY